MSTVSGSELVYFGILIFGVLLGLAISIRSVSRYGLSAFALRPIVPFALFFSLIHFVTPLIKSFEGIYRYQEDYPPDQKIFVAVLNMSLLAFAWLLSSSRQFSPIPKPSLNGQVSGRGTSRHTLVATFIFAIGLVFAIQDVFIITTKIGYLQYQLDVHRTSEMRSSLRLLSNLMVLGAALLTSSLLSRKKTKLRFVLIVLLALPIIGYAIFLNSRNTVLIATITITAVYLGFMDNVASLKRTRKFKFSIKRSTVKKGVVLALVGVTLYFVFAFMSEQRYGRAISDYTLERREKPIVYGIDGAFGNDENLLWLVGNNDYDLLFGKTYLAGLLVVIPRKIWAGKPDGAGPYLINLIRPGSYIKGASGNNSLTTGLLTEALMNFGFLGMFAGIIVWAYLSSRFVRAFHRSANVILKTAFLISALLLSTTFLYQEFLGFFARAFVVVAPLLIAGSLIGSPKLSQKHQ